MSDDLEDGSGNVISAFENEKVVLVGNVYVPIKQFDGATWIRVFHHNNLSGTNMWSSISQSLTKDEVHYLYKAGKGISITIIHKTRILLF